MVCSKERGRRDLYTVTVAAVPGINFNIYPLHPVSGGSFSRQLPVQPGSIAKPEYLEFTS